MSRVTHQPTGSIPVLVLPYTVVPPGAAPYEYEANIALANRNLGFVERVTRLIMGSQFKRQPPVIARMGRDSIGWDFRYPGDGSS